jgi:superfamily II DNA/RNA helicase
LSSFHDFGPAEPITRARAEERYVVPTPIQDRHFSIAMSNHHVVGISQLDTVTAAVVTLPILHRLIHRTHEPIDLVFIRARHRAVKHPPSPLKVGGSAEANHSNSSQNQRASRCGKVCISVASGIAMRGHRVGCISHRVNCDRLDVLASYVLWNGRTTRSNFRRHYFMLQSRRNVVVAGDREADWDITLATNQRAVRPPQHLRAKAPAARSIGAGHRRASAWRATGEHRSRHAPTTPRTYTRQPARIADSTDGDTLCAQMTKSTVKQN